MYIVIKKPDKGIIILYPNLNIYGEDKVPFSQEKILLKYIEEGYEWFLSDEVIDKKDLESRRQLYWDGNSIKKDLSWGIRLMFCNIIKSKHFSKLNQKLDTELSKEIPDSIIIAKIQREKEKCRSYTEKDWYEQALKNLDERVAGGEPDKPVIREKLMAKLNGE